MRACVREDRKNKRRDNTAITVYERVVHDTCMYRGVVNNTRQYKGRNQEDRSERTCQQKTRYVYGVMNKERNDDPGRRRGHCEF